MYYIKWKSCKATTSAYYYTDSEYNDRVTQRCTGQLLQSILAEFQLAYPTLVWDNMGLSFLITKPLGNSVPLAPLTIVTPENVQIENTSLSLGKRKRKHKKRKKQKKQKKQKIIN